MKIAKVSHYVVLSLKGFKIRTEIQAINTLILGNSNETSDIIQDVSEESNYVIEGMWTFICFHYQAILLSVEEQKAL